MIYKFVYYQIYYKMELGAEQLRLVMAESAQERQRFWLEAEDSAVKHLTNILTSPETKEEMLEAAKRGRNHIDFYQWTFVSDKDTRFMFNGIRILDLIKRSALIKRLNELVNPENKSEGYVVGWRKVKPYPVRSTGGPIKKSGPAKYTLFISWAAPRRHSTG